MILNQHGVAGVISYCNREGRWLTCVTRYEELTGCPPVDYVPGRYRIAPDGQSLIQDFEVHYSIDYETCSLVDITDLFARSGQPVPGGTGLLSPSWRGCGFWLSAAETRTTRRSAPAGRAGSDCQQPKPARAAPGVSRQALRSSR